MLQPDTLDHVAAQPDPRRLVVSEHGSGVPKIGYGRDHWIETLGHHSRLNSVIPRL